ncbi:phosphatase PAP2 family protein [Gordonia zhaorongruii]|uniref:phosphatase PAP2 family protein n=1 Tax=Gordonia zhaorongruii TaxID=2597659 RepID=UPI00104E990A|nr:phosphatase PAP2 family protein [Gordonia zhaorongruii]
MRNNPRLIAGLLLFTAVCVVGIWIALDDSVPALDRAVTDAVVSHRIPLLTSITSAVTLACSPVAVSAWTMLAAVLLLLRDRTVHRALPLVATVAVAGVVGEILKITVHRHRPPATVQLGPHEAAFSYPSGHVLGTTAFVLTLLLVTTAGSGRAVRGAARFVAPVIVTVAAFTRLYLGAHWLTDVAAAIALGIAASLIVPVWATALEPVIAQHSPPLLRPYLSTDAGSQAAPQRSPLSCSARFDERPQP